LASRSDLLRALRDSLRVLGAPVRRAGSRGGIVLQPYRGYGSRRRAFLIGRVFRQRSMTEVQGPWDLRRQVRDVIRRLVRRPVKGALVRGVLLGAAAETRTDDEGYFRLDWTLPGAPEDRRWHDAELEVADPPGARGAAGVYIPPPHARFAVISDIDDTVMHTGVANKAGMMWRLFVQNAESRTAFPGVATLYRALHDGVAGDEGNPMLYVSRAPWGIYDVLTEFFHRHDIPGGPILLLREWGVSWRSPLPRRAEDHKRVLIEAIMEIYHDLPFVLIGDSGQHDPAVYRDAVERYGPRVRAIYIRDISPHSARIRAEISDMKAAVAAAGSELVLAEDTVVMAEHAAGLGFIAPEAVDAVRGRQPSPEASADHEPPDR
jgi:phosphatidate phosphatase APP1